MNFREKLFNIFTELKGNLEKFDVAVDIIFKKNQVEIEIFHLQ